MSQPEAITSLVDAEPAPWQADKRPEPTPEQTALFRACAALIETQEAMRAFVGARSGPAWIASTQAYREAWAEFDAVFRQIKGEGA